jgi:hypothetical protein
MRCAFGVEFRHFRVRHFENFDDKELRHLALKTLKSQNATFLWTRIPVFRHSEVREVKEAMILELRVSNSRFVKSQRTKGKIIERLSDKSRWAPIDFQGSRTQEVEFHGQHNSQNCEERNTERQVPRSGQGSVKIPKDH